MDLPSPSDAAPTDAAPGELERVLHASGLLTWRSPALRAAGVLHGFSTRIGGVSVGAVAALNMATHALGQRVDEPERVRENHRRLRAALGVGERPLARIVQVHGADVVAAEEALGEPLRADGVASASEELLCSVSGADCLPILLARRDGRAVAAVHAGWRGLVAGVLQRAVEVLGERHGAAPRELCAAIGPGISAARFEVGEEVAAEFVRAGHARRVLGTGPRPHVDLAGAAADVLLAAGLEPAQIERAPCCTHEDAHELFSHRREGGRTGRQVGWIVARGA